MTSGRGLAAIVLTAALSAAFAILGWPAGERDAIYLHHHQPRHRDVSAARAAPPMSACSSSSNPVCPASQLSSSGRTSWPPEASTYSSTRRPSRAWTPTGRTPPEPPRRHVVLREHQQPTVDPVHLGTHARAHKDDHWQQSVPRSRLELPAGRHASAVLDLHRRPPSAVVVCERGMTCPHPRVALPPRPRVEVLGSGALKSPARTGGSSRCWQAGPPEMAWNGGAATPVTVRQEPPRPTHPRPASATQDLP